MHYGLQPRDLNDLTEVELEAFLAHLGALRRSNDG